MANNMRKLIALAFLLPSHLVVAQRLMVPDYVTCDRNQLTSWTGPITDYTHKHGTTQFTVITDDGTIEALSLKFETVSELMKQYFLNGKSFVQSDWQRIESTHQQLLSGIRATVWLCLDESVPPVVNWQGK